MYKADFFFGFYHFGNQTNVCDLAAAPAGAKENQVAFLQVFFLYAGADLALFVGTAGELYIYGIKGLAKQAGTVYADAGSAAIFVGGTVIRPGGGNNFFYFFIGAAAGQLFVSFGFFPG